MDSVQPDQAFSQDTIGVLASPGDGPLPIDQHFLTLFSYVLQDMLLRPLKKKRASLPPSWTAAQLRAIEMNSGASVRTLVNTLFNSTEEKLWRRHAPRMAPDERELTKSERSLCDAVSRHMAATCGNNEAAQVAAAERYRRVIYLWQTMHARGACPITPERFFHIISLAVEARLISARHGDLTLYTSALVYSMQRALLEWHRQPGHSIRALYLISPSYELLAHIQTEMGPYIDGLPRNVASAVAMHFSDLASTLRLVNGSSMRIAANEATQFARRDQVRLTTESNQQPTPIWFGEEEFDLFLSLTEIADSAGLLE